MGFQLSRLRAGEAIAGISAVLLMSFMFLLPWYAPKIPVGWTAATLGVPASYTGWQELTGMRWLLLLTPLLAIALAYFQATRRAPAVPATLSVVVLVLAGLTVLLLVYRVLISVPGSGGLSRKVGAYVGLLSTVGIACGAYLSLRREGVSAGDGPKQIETVKLGGTTPS